MTREPHEPNPWLRRVQALLAKAASTEFPAEAESLLTKAQELMARHAINEAMLDHAGSGARTPVVTEHLTVEPPYASARAALLGVIARANHSRVVTLGGGGGTELCAIVGRRSDIGAAMTLFAALSMHATRAMLDAAPAGTPRVRAFRHAFLLAFANRIGERLREAAEAARLEEERSRGESVALVLCARSQEVDDAFVAQFPHTRPVRRQLSSAAGCASGRRAADSASLGAPPLAGRQGLGPGAA